MEPDAAILEASLRLLANTKVSQQQQSALSASVASFSSIDGHGSNGSGIVAVVKAEDVHYYECSGPSAAAAAAAATASSGRDLMASSSANENDASTSASASASSAAAEARASIAEVATRLLARAMRYPEVAINPARFAAYFESRADSMLRDYASEVRAIVTSLTGPAEPTQMTQPQQTEPKAKKD